MWSVFRIFNYLSFNFSTLVLYLTGIFMFSKFYNYLHEFKLCIFFKYFGLYNLFRYNLS